MEARKYILQYLKSNDRFTITIPKLLVSALSRTKGDKAQWKLHPNGKDLILEFE